MYTPIVLDKTRNLRFGMKAIHVLEKALKTPMSKLDFDNMTMEDTATIIWAGLVHEDADLTTDKVMDLIDEFSNLKDALKIMADAFKDSFGTGEEVVEGGTEKNE